MPRAWIGYVFLLATVLLYAGIGVMSRTSDASGILRSRSPRTRGVQRYGDGRGLDVGGVVHRHGRDAVFAGLLGSAFIMGWTGGYVLVALFLAPYLRKFGQFTIPDFLGARYGGNTARFVGVLIAILCSFVYVVAQIYGVGLITARLTGLSFSRCICRARRNSRLLVSRRYARGHLDAGRAVHHPDHCLHDPGGVVVDETHQHPHPAAGLRHCAGESIRA